ncbi:hypothetical protein JZ751_022560 [Albula glossodonta]|uniref:Uncharacterized protein n=1 Tax=Albula glossodonta TaxID=121402 RepID=A0A8T2PFM7_9TELE|nr:hypothetical protein JZ751_022560 [Albula glossodonta]
MKDWNRQQKHLCSQCIQKELCAVSGVSREKRHTALMVLTPHHTNVCCANSSSLTLPLTTHPGERERDKERWSGQEREKKKRKMRRGSG